MWTDAFAQTPGAPGGAPGLGSLLMLPYFIVVFVVFYLLMIRPQRQKQKALEAMIQSLKKGDRVVTSGGIIGTVIGIDDQKAVLRIAEHTTVEFTKGSIVQVMAAESK